MTLTLHLDPDLEQRLIEEARQHGASPDEYTIRLLDQHLSSRAPRQEFVALLQSWIDTEDAEEQVETGDYLIRSLDEDRLSDRPLFPPELEGVTW